MTHAEPFAVQHARATLADMPVSEPTKAHTLTLITNVSTPTTIVPSITADDSDTALLHWLSGTVSIEVEVTPDGPRYMWCQVNGNTHVHATQKIEAALNGLLAAQSARAAKSNANWQDQFKSSRHPLTKDHSA